MKIILLSAHIGVREKGISKILDIDLIFGIYELKSIESFKDGDRTNEKENSGMFTFTRQKTLAVVNGSNEWVMAYSGTFDIIEDELVIQVKACVSREMENTSIVRKILSMDGENLVLNSIGSDKSKQTKITWKKIVKL